MFGKAKNIGGDIKGHILSLRIASSLHAHLIFQHHQLTTTQINMEYWLTKHVKQARHVALKSLTIHMVFTKMGIQMVLLLYTRYIAKINIHTVHALRPSKRARTCFTI